MPHGRFVHLHVDVVSAGQLDLFADLLVVAHLVLNLLRLHVGVPGVGHLVGQIGVGPQERPDQLVKGHTLRLVVLQGLGVGGAGRAEETQIGSRVSRRLDWLAQCFDRLAKFLQPLPAFLQPIFQQAGNIFLLIAVEGLTRVVLDRLLQRLE